MNYVLGRTIVLARRFAVDLRLDIGESELLSENTAQARLQGRMWHDNDRVFVDDDVSVEAVLMLTAQLTFMGMPPSTAFTYRQPTPEELALIEKSLRSIEGNLRA